MNRHDRRAWRSVRTWGDLGTMTVAWLHGTVEQTPGHMGPPCEETIPLIPALTAANQAGFITTNSQRGDHNGSHSWEAWACGLLPNRLLPALQRALAGTPLELRLCRKRQHDHRRGWGCAWREDTGFYGDRCPDLQSEIYEAWGVIIVDPVPDRNDVLWPALERFAAWGGSHV